MKELNWTVGYTENPDIPPQEMFPAEVPGSAQLDYAQAKQLPSYLQDDNCRLYSWMENVFWIYQTELDFSLSDHQVATLPITPLAFGILRHGCADRK